MSPTRRADVGRGRMPRRWTPLHLVLSLLVATVLVALVLSGGVDGLARRLGLPDTRSTQDVLDALPPSKAADALRALPGRDEEDAPDYSREAFGEAWADVDHNGCDTRNDILARDLAGVTLKRGSTCVVASGHLHDPYTGQDIAFTRGVDTSEAVQIDHVVALADAWRAGAWRWSEERRQRFANEPMNLLAVDGPTNRDKGDARADQWMPPRAAFHCEYAVRQIRVKSEWGLSVTEGERRALGDALATCAH